MDYIILHGEMEELIFLVNKHLRAGYKPLGGVVLIETIDKPGELKTPVVMQAVVKE